MSEVFEQDIDEKDGEDLSLLEDPVNDELQDISAEKFVFPDVLYKTKLEYSSEGVYVTVPNGMVLKDTDFVIIQTRYGKDLARVLGKAEQPVGIRPEDVVMIERKATEADLEKAKDLIKKEAEAFKIFQEKVAAHNLDMKLIATHYLLEEQKVLFFFSAENRVDFRELVKDLVSVFKMRIELRQTGKMLSEASRSFARTLEYVEKPAALLDLDYQMTFASQALLDITGRHIANMLGRNFFEEIIRNPDLSKRSFQEAVRQSNTTAFTLALEIRTQKGVYEERTWTVVPCKDDNGTIESYGLIEAD